MHTTTTRHGFLARTVFAALLDGLKTAGYRCLGPQVRDGAIVYDVLQRVADLPIGISDHQAPGTYRLEAHASPRCFAWANGPQALKPLLFSPQETLWHVTRSAEGRLAFVPVKSKPEPTAVIGVRACDLAALQLQDQHFLQGQYADPLYAARRQSLFLVAVNCTHPAATCFCSSTGDGPAARQGYDLLLNELDEGFIVTSGSAQGEALMAQLPLESVSQDQWQYALKQIDAAAKQQPRALPGTELRDTLMARLEHGRWQDVAQRCLSCGNCTSVCPTCFCHHEHEQAALTGTVSEHVRAWDSCFSPGHSYIHGLTIRPDTASRYRQWLTHKLATWHDQYGRSGCVGCGRCISWCPVGIDITEEVQAICHD